MHTHPSPRNLAAVDLFCGVGGLTCGLRQAGIDVRAGFDLDASCEFAFAANNDGARFVRADIQDITAETIRSHLADAEVSAMVGCAPCQPFSALRRRQRKGNNADARWGLLQDFGNLVCDVLPDVVSMENVPDLRKQPVYQDFLGQLKQAGYHIGFSDIVNCADYGVPQTRRRLVALASRHGEIRLTPPKQSGRRQTVREALSPPMAAQDPADIHVPLSKKNLERIRQSGPGGSWRDWDPDLVLPCHGERGHAYPASYGRMRWDAPAPTITTQFCYYGCGRFGHPEEDRTITVREAALLQTFPPDYAFLDAGEDPSVTAMARHIGNAVPPALGRAIGESIVRHVLASYNRLTFKPPSRRIGRLSGLARDAAGSDKPEYQMNGV